jgi:hypothetical protein
VTHTSDLNDDAKSQKTWINSAADDVIGKPPQGRRKTWFDQECQEVTRQKNEIAYIGKFSIKVANG